MSAPLNRREWVAALASGAALAQTSPPPATPDQELEAARKRQRETIQALDKFKLKMSSEPAFRFEA